MPNLHQFIYCADNAHHDAIAAELVQSPNCTVGFVAQDFLVHTDRLIGKRYRVTKLMAKDGKESTRRTVYLKYGAAAACEV
jgi:hypothetical protein